MSTIRLGSRTTAEQALRGASLSGKRAIVTGASSGLGVETTRVLALAGADVTLAVRSVPAGEAVAADLRAALPLTAGKLDVRPLDLADLASVRAFTDAIGAEGRPLDLLINNAGVMAPPLGKTAQGFELQLGTNHLGHFLLTERLRPRMTAGRIVNVSSGLHTRGSGARLLETLDGDRAYERRKYVLWILKSPFLLRQLMLQPTMDTLLGDDVGACLAPSDPHMGAFARRAPARVAGLAAPTARAGALPASAVAAREAGPLALGRALACVDGMANGARHRQT
jgi:NAD(P)-dependent dehydrogenase (short-subunit alcohol dehydrogenase family)